MDNTDPQTSGVIPGTEGLSGAQPSSAGGDSSSQPGAATVQPQSMPAGATQVAAPAPQTQPSPASSSASSAPMAAPGTPHAGLRNMLQSLFEGMDAFATAAATGGKEGGVEEIQKLNAQRQDMALKRQAGQREQESHDVQMKATNANLLMQTAAYHHNLQMYPLEERTAALDLNNKATAAYTDALNSGYDLQDTGQAAAWAKLQNRVIKVAFGPNQDPNEVMAGTKSAAEKNGGSLVDYVPMVHYNDAKHGSGGEISLFPADGLQSVNATPRQIATGLADAKNTLLQATAAFGADNPDVQKFQGRIQGVSDLLSKGGNISAYDMQQLKMLSQGPMATMIGGKEKATKIQQEQAAAKDAANKADPLFKMENDPGEMSGEKSSAAIPLLQNKLSDPNTAPADKVRATRLLAQATSAHARFQQDQIQKANAEQAAKQGDPLAAGKALAEGTLTLADLKTRGMTPKFILDVKNAAQKIDPTYNPADENIAEKVASAPGMNQLFASANSLITPKTGTLDQLVEAGTQIPNHKFPVFNKIDDAKKFQSGDPAVAAYMQTALGVADDYAKVVGGGTPSEHMQMLVLNSITGALNQDQRVAVVNAMRKAVNSGVESKIGTNKFLNRIYGRQLPQNQPAAAAFDPKTDFKPIQNASQ